MKPRTIFLIAAFLLFVVLTTSGLWYLRTESFQELIRTNLISNIESRTGLRCSIKNLEIDIYRGNFRIDDLELKSKEARPGFSTLTIREIRAKFSLSSLWHFRVRLSQLHLVNPQVEFVTGGEKTDGEKTGRDWNSDGFLKTLNFSLRLETEALTVQEGLVKINEKSAPFNLSLEALDCRIGYDGNNPSYRIFLEYKQSRLFYEQRDIIHDLKLIANLSPQGIGIENIEFRHRESLLSGSGSVKNWESPALELDMAGVVSALDLVLADASLNEGKGEIDVNTKVRYDGDGIYLKGDFFASDGAYRKMAYSDMAGNFEILHDVLYLRDVSGKIAQGVIAVEGEIQLRKANNKPNQLTFQAENFPLVEVGNLLLIPSLGYRNVVDSKTLLTWGWDRNTTIDCDSVLYGAQGEVEGGLKGTPLGGKVQFSYLGDGVVNLHSVNLESSHTRLSASGGEDAPFRVLLSTDRLAEPLDLIANFSPPVSNLAASYPELSEIQGAFDFKGDVRIHSSSDIEYKGSMTVKDGRWQSVEMDTLDTIVQFAGSHLDFSNLSIRRGLQAVQGDLSLDFADEDQISGFGFQGDLKNIQMSSLSDYGEGALDVTGVLDGSGEIRYEESLWAGSGRLSVITGSFKGEPFDRLATLITLENRRIHFKGAEIVRGGAGINAEGYVDPDTGSLNLTTHLKHLPLNAIPALKKKELPLRGYINASGTVYGTTQSPIFSGTFELENLSYETWDLGHGKGVLEFEGDVFDGTVQIQTEFGDFSLQAQLALTAGYPGSIALGFDNFNLRKIVSDKTPAYLKEISTALQGRITGDGRFSDWDALEWHGEVDGAQFKIQDHELSNFDKIRFSIADNELLFENARIKGDGTNLFLSGVMPLDDSPNLSMDLNGSINLEVISGIMEKLDTSGSAVVNIRAEGSKEDPQIIGRIGLVDARLDYDDIPFPISALRGDVVLSTNIVRFENVRGTASSGSLQLAGTYEHRNMVMQSINLGITIEGIRLLFPKDFRSVFDAELRLSGDRDLQSLTGEVNVIRSEYIRNFSLLERFIESGGARSNLLDSEPKLQNLRLNVDIRSNNGLVIDNKLARVQGSLRLTLRGTPAYPSLTGRVEAGEGTVSFRGNRFEFMHAYADFIDRNRINPILEIRAEADVKTYRLILDATGSLDNLSVNIRSDPPMSTVDIISLLTTGMTDAGDQTSQRESQMAGMSAASVLSENLTGVIGERVQNIFGLESFRVDPFLAGANNDPTARITISERISRDLVVTYSRNLSTQEEQVFVIEYDVGKNLTIIGTRDEYGKYGVDFRFRKRF